MKFANRVVLITGASSGIGWALAKEFAKQGAKLGLLARREAELAQLCQEIRTSGGIAEYRIADVRDREGLHKGIRELEQVLGPSDVVIANSGVGATDTIGNTNITGAENVIQVNLLGVMYTIDAVIPGMVARKSGHIVAISSLASYKGLPQAAAYCASKSAVNAYMESMRITNRKTGVSFTTICPGFIRTPMVANNEGMFLVLEADVAARKMVNAIAKKKKVFNFPWLMYRLLRLLYWVPDWVMHWFMPIRAGGTEDRSGN